jgi:hypothetical protein
LALLVLLLDGGLFLAQTTHKSGAPGIGGIIITMTSTVLRADYSLSWSPPQKVCIDAVCSAHA